MTRTARPRPATEQAQELERILRDTRTQLGRLDSTRLEAQAKRDEAIRQALAIGWTHAVIAELTGLSRGRISQLVSK